MITVDELRTLALAYPEVEEFAHFRSKQPAFRVRGTPFAGMDKGGGTAVFSVDRTEAASAVAEAPEIYAEVWRPGRVRSLVGVRVDLAAVSIERVRELVDHAWRHKAPRRLVAAYDAARGDGSLATGDGGANGHSS